MNAVACINDMIARGTVTDEDVLTLRRAMYGNDHVIDRAEAEALFRLNDAADGACTAWPDLFCEAMVDFCVRQSEPHGYVSDDMAQWLIARVAASGRVKTATEMEALIKVMETAREVPQVLEDFAIKQVHEAVLNGGGVTRSGETLEPGQIGRGEVELLRRILYAAGGDKGLSISRREAELLFDINDAVADKSQDPAWADLFVKANANYLMAAQLHAPVSRADALRREAWLDDTDTSVGDYFGRILSGGLRGFLDAVRHDSDAAAWSSATSNALRTCPWPSRSTHQRPTGWSSVSTMTGNCTTPKRRCCCSSSASRRISTPVSSHCWTGLPDLRIPDADWPQLAILFADTASVHLTWAAHIGVLSALKGDGSRFDCRGQLTCNH
jgi:hypothetical protein